MMTLSWIFWVEFWAVWFHVKQPTEPPRHCATVTNLALWRLDHPTDHGRAA